MSIRARLDKLEKQHAPEADSFVVGLEDPPGVVSVNHEKMTLAEWEKLAKGYDKALLIVPRLRDVDCQASDTL